MRIVVGLDGRSGAEETKCLGRRRARREFPEVCERWAWWKSSSTSEVTPVLNIGWLRGLISFDGKEGFVRGTNLGTG